MAAKIITVFNQAGGVGKTTLVMNLGYHLAQRGLRTLLIDMDPQASLTTFMGLDPVELDVTIYESLIDTAPVPVMRDLHGMTLAPANLNLSAAELELVVADMRDSRLKDALTPLQNDFDVVLVDCPPSLGILTYISLVAAHEVLVPIQTQFKAFQGTDLLLRTVKRVRARPNRGLKIAGFLPTMFDGRNSQDERTYAAIKEQLARFGEVFTPLPRSTAFADAAEARQPLALYQPKHPAVAVLDVLSESLERRWEGAYEWQA
jgi:chromosome partitioning protein